MLLGTYLSLPRVSPRNGLQKRWRKWTPSRTTRVSGSKENFPALYIVRLPTSHHHEHQFPHLARRRRRHRKNHRRRLQTVLRLKPFTSRCVPRCVQFQAPLLFHACLISMQLSAKWRQKSWQCASGCKFHPSPHEGTIFNRFEILYRYNHPDGAGTTTSGGTESILMSCKAHRDWALATKGITEPEM